MNSLEELIIGAGLPERTKSYTPISHRSIIRNIENACDDNNLSIVDRSYQVNDNYSQVTGKYTLSLDDGETGCMLAWQNSYNKTMSVKFAAGASVFICSNGMVSGEYAMARKHTGNSDLELLSFIKNSLNNSVDNFHEVVQMKEDMKTIRLTENSINELIGNVFLNETLRIEQLSFVKKEYIAPTYNYGVDKNNLWNIYNLFTDSIERKSHPSLYLTQNQAITNLIKNRFL